MVGCRPGQGYHRSRWSRSPEQMQPLGPKSAGHAQEARPSDDPQPDCPDPDKHLHPDMGLLKHCARDHNSSSDSICTYMSCQHREQTVLCYRAADSTGSIHHSATKTPNHLPDERGQDSLLPGQHLVLGIDKCRLSPHTVTSNLRPPSSGSTAPLRS